MYTYNVMLVYFKALRCHMGRL